MGLVGASSMPGRMSNIRSYTAHYHRNTFSLLYAKAFMHAGVPTNSTLPLRLYYRKLQGVLKWY